MEEDIQNYLPTVMYRGTSCILKELNLENQDYFQKLINTIYMMCFYEFENIQFLQNFVLRVEQ